MMGYPTTLTPFNAEFKPGLDLAGKYAGLITNPFGSSNVPAATAGMSSGPQMSTVPSIEELMRQSGGDVDKAAKLQDAYLKQQENQFLFSLASPEAQAQRQQQELERAGTFYKQLGDQMEKYRMTNEIIGNIGQAAKAAFMRYPDPTTLANIYGNVATAYSQGQEASRGLTQLGSGLPATQYYKV